MKIKLPKCLQLMKWKSKQVSGDKLWLTDNKTNKKVLFIINDYKFINDKHSISNSTNNETLFKLKQNTFVSEPPLMDLNKKQINGVKRLQRNRLHVISKPIKFIETNC